jgi:hypothetical protein
MSKRSSDTKLINNKHKKVKRSNVKKTKSLLNLPEDLIKKILIYLDDEEDHKNIKLTSRFLYHVSISDIIMRNIVFMVGQDLVRLNKLFKLNPNGIGHLRVILTVDNVDLISEIGRKKCFNVLHMDVMDVMGVDSRIIKYATEISCKEYQLCFDNDILFSYEEFYFNFINTENVIIQNLYMLEKRDFNEDGLRDIGNVLIEGGNFDSLQFKNSAIRKLNIKSADCKSLKVTDTYIHEIVDLKNISKIKSIRVMKENNNENKIDFINTENVYGIDWNDNIGNIDWLDKYPSLENLGLSMHDKNDYSKLIILVTKNLSQIKRLLLRYECFTLMYIVGKNKVTTCHIYCNKPIRELINNFILLPLSKYISEIYLQNYMGEVSITTSGLFQGISRLKKVTLLNCYDTELKKNIMRSETYRRAIHNNPIIGFLKLPWYFAPFRCLNT